MSTEREGIKMTMTEAEQMIRMGSNIDADVWNTVVDAMHYGSAM